MKKLIIVFYQEKSIHCIKQNHIIVLDMWEINVWKKKYSKTQVDLHKLRKSKSISLCLTLPYGLNEKDWFANRMQ